MEEDTNSFGSTAADVEKDTLLDKEGHESWREDRRQTVCTLLSVPRILIFSVLLNLLVLIVVLKMAFTMIIEENHLPNRGQDIYGVIPDCMLSIIFSSRLQGLIFYFFSFDQVGDVHE